MTIEILSKNIKKIVPLKHDKIIKNFKFHYGFYDEGLDKKRTKGIFYHLNHIFNYNKENYKFKLKSNEISEIIKLSFVTRLTIKCLLSEANEYLQEEANDMLYEHSTTVCKMNRFNWVGYEDENNDLV
jgi:hypothetical protein